MWISLPRKDMINWVVMGKYNPFCVLNERPATSGEWDIQCVSLMQRLKNWQNKPSIAKSQREGNEASTFLKETATPDSWWDGEIYIWGRPACLFVVWLKEGCHFFPPQLLANFQWILVVRFSHGHMTLCRLALKAEISMDWKNEKKRVSLAFF